MFSKADRKRAEDFVIRLMSTIDPSGYNAKYYHRLFTQLSDKDMYDWALRIEAGTTHLWLYAPIMKVKLTQKDLDAAAKLTGTPLEEQVSIYDPSTDRRYTSPHKYFIIRVPVRRLKQYLMDKLSVPDSDRRLNPITGQVTKPDDSSSISISEAQTYDAKGLQVPLTEFINIRGGNINAYSSLRHDLEQTGIAHMGDLDNSGKVQSTRAANAFLTAMCLRNNL